MREHPFVLSGGGARAFAHLGAVKALGESGIYPSGIAATSAGAVAGAFLANGFSPDEIKEIFISKSRLHLFAWNGFDKGLISFRRIDSFLKQNLRYKNFE